MVKHPKQVFSIVEEGHTIRLVHMVRDRNQVYLRSMDRVDLDAPVYRHTEDLPEASPEKNSWESDNQVNDEINLDDFGTDIPSDIRVAPWENMLNGYDLRHGVIALNVNEDNLIRSPEDIHKPKDIKQFAKANLSPELYKAKEWTGFRVRVNQRPSLWFHKGNFVLLNMLLNYAKVRKQNMYFQLADANDVALADYFRINSLDPEKRTLLVYLGQEYRRAFLFEKGHWVHTLTLQISQKSPEPDFVYSKISLALDSAQLKDPEEIVLCGDLANRELLEYLGKQYNPDMVHMMSFSHIVLDSERAEYIDADYLVQFALPIALGYKALHPEDGRYNQTNFLPYKVVEGQKTYKVAWHGMLVLTAVFVVAFIGTIAILKANQQFRQATELKRQQEITLAKRRAEAAEIQEIRNALEKQHQLMEVIKSVLTNKNPWSLVLDTLNRKFAQRPVSWITSLRREQDKLALSGTTTNRQNIVEFAAVLPNSRIIKVNHAKIKERTVWVFEIRSDMPTVDWMALIQQDLDEVMAFKQMYGEAGKQNGSAVAPVQKPGGPLLATTPDIKNLKPYKGLAPLAAQYMPVPTDRIVKDNASLMPAYNAFIAAVNRGNLWEYRDLSAKFITNNRRSPLVPYFQWHMANRMFIDRDWDMVRLFTEPLLKEMSDLYPYALLVEARTDFVKDNPAYKAKYVTLQNDYARHPISGQIKADLAIINKGGAK